SQNIYISGWTGTGDGDVYLKKYSESGIFQWQVTWGNGSSEQPRDMTWLPSGKIIIVGTREIDSTLIKFILCFDADDGTELWSNIYEEGVFHAIDATEDNQFVVYAENPGEGVVTKFTEQGTDIWSYTMTSTHFITDVDICFDSEENVYFMGRKVSGSDGDVYTDTYLSRLQNDGGFLWEEQVGADHNNFLNSMEIGPDGYIYLLGYTRLDTEDQEILIEKYDSSGDRDWIIRQRDTSDTPWPKGLEIDTDGRVYAITSSSSGEYVEYWTSPSGSLERTIAINQSSIDVQTFGMDNYDNLILSFYSDTGNHKLMKRYKDQTPPQITHPLTFRIEAGSENNTLRWDITENDLRRYSLYIDEQLFLDDQEIDGDFVEIEDALEGLELGFHNFTILVEDWQGNVASSTVIVQVVEDLFIAGVMDVLIATGIVSAILIIALVGGYTGKKWYDQRELETSDDLHVSQGVEVPETQVKVLRGAEFVGNRLRYKVKVANESSSVITDVTITLVSYPKDSLKLYGEITKVVPKIDPEGFRSPSYEFAPTQDCVKGLISATVSFVDHKGTLHSTSTEPYEIRAVCDLLTPESITPEEFGIQLTELDRTDLTVKVDDWTPKEMHTKTLQALKESNFFQVGDHQTEKAGKVEREITGWAKGKYTGKNLGIQVTIIGTPGEKGAVCKLEMIGEDESMILPALDEISKRLSTWLCPQCNATLPMEIVQKLKLAECCECPFCGAVIDR
ncbi:MAG: PQQ-binding-like beta-propeller repeat protein, partial [Candidatus Lokiarchaeota archaeon]|nr:PQQ-binding-like beta-propeller repeat protein [Candidatus Lokiarchaeota archaeon]